MKKPVTLFLCMLLVVQFSQPAFAQSGAEASYYVVIGAFAKKRNAINFTSTSQKYNAKYDLNPIRKLDYVYIMRTDDKQVAVDEALRMRQIKGYDSTWVYYGYLGKENVLAIQGEDINPVTAKKLSSVADGDKMMEEQERATKNEKGVFRSSENTAANNQNAGGNTSGVQDSRMVGNATGNTSNNTSGSTGGKTTDTSPTNTSGGNSNPINSTSAKTPDSNSQVSPSDSLAQEEEEEELNEPEDPLARPFIFKISRIDTKAEIEGTVDVIDTDRAKKIGTYEGHKRVKVAAPANPEGTVSFICEVFGYRKVQRDLNYADPEGPGVSRDEGATIVPFELMRLQKGDIATMFHVYFFKDAAVMRPESRYEVNSLLGMMQENPKYKIRIHGHTNGNASGKITRLRKDADNYFSLTNTVDGYGSAKKLSQQRAEHMRDYLVANGISESRLQIKAWGGKRPIVDKFHPQAQANVRVEIEILEN